MLADEPSGKAAWGAVKFGLAVVAPAAFFQRTAAVVAVAPSYSEKRGAGASQRWGTQKVLLFWCPSACGRTPCPASS